eukprot:gene5412-biopygen9633
MYAACARFGELHTPHSGSTSVLNRTFILGHFLQRPAAGATAKAIRVGPCLGFVMLLPLRTGVDSAHTSPFLPPSGSTVSRRRAAGLCPRHNHRWSEVRDYYSFDALARHFCVVEWPTAQRLLRGEKSVECFGQLVGVNRNAERYKFRSPGRPWMLSGRGTGNLLHSGRH